MKKLITFALLIFSTTSIFCAGIFEYYINTNMANYGNYGGGTSWDGASLATGLDMNASPVLNIDLTGMKTWEDGNDDIVAARLYYRVYPSSGTAPAYSSLNLPQFGGQVGNNREWQDGTDIDLLAGVTDDGDYIVDIYFEADGTYPGGTFNLYEGTATAPLSATFNVATALPISLTAFDAIIQGTSVEIKWETASEINHDRFEIERCAAPNQWETIGEELSGGYDSHLPKTYTFVDDRPRQGVNYYRLRQVDFDGTESFSDIIQVVIKAKTPNFAVFPNPAQNFVHLRSEAKQAEATVRILDRYGRLLKEAILNDAAGAISKINISELPKGFLFFQINEEAPQQILHL